MHFYNLVIREWLNGALFPLNVALTFAIGVYLGQSFLEARNQCVSFRYMSGVQTACSLWWVFLCEAIRSGAVYASLNAGNRDVELPPQAQEFASVSLAVAALILCITLLRCIYLFTPRSWAGYFTFASVLVTCAFLIFTHWHVL